jgi:hypothetical protein
MGKAIRTINLEELIAILSSDKFIVIDPLTPQLFIYEPDDDEYFEKEQIAMEEDVYDILEEWVDSKVIAKGNMTNVPLGVFYDTWGPAFGKQPDEAKKRAVALGLM